jgi:hypothetical protein
MKPDHLFKSYSGELHDTRDPQWSSKPLRAIYSQGYGDIRTTAEYKAVLRHGPHAFPGGYPLYLICSDGAALCFSCGRKELRNILEAIRDKDRSGWRVVACDINYEDTDLYCDHCSKPIESAYGEDK